MMNDSWSGAGVVSHGVVWLVVRAAMMGNGLGARELAAWIDRNVRLGGARSFGGCERVGGCEARGSAHADWLAG